MSMTPEGFKALRVRAIENLGQAARIARRTQTIVTDERLGLPWTFAVAKENERSYRRMVEIATVPALKLVIVYATEAAAALLREDAEKKEGDK